MNENYTVEFPLKPDWHTLPILTCIECQKDSLNNIMTCRNRRMDSEEYRHETEIADYQCSHGHSFRMVVFL